MQRRGIRVDSVQGRSDESLRVVRRTGTAKALNLAGSPQSTDQKLNVAAARTGSPWHSLCLAVESAFLSHPVHCLQVLGHPSATYNPRTVSRLASFFLATIRHALALNLITHSLSTHHYTDLPPCRSLALLHPNEAAAGQVLDSMPTSRRVEAPPPWPRTAKTTQSHGLPPKQEAIKSTDTRHIKSMARASLASTCATSRRVCPSSTTVPGTSVRPRKRRRAEADGLLHEEATLPISKPYLAAIC